VQYGWPFAVFGLFTVAALGYADLVMARKLRALRGVQRVQVAYVLAGLVASQVIAIVTMIVIPLVWDSTAYSGWGTSGYVITVLGMAYAIAKHRLMRPEVALRRVATYLLAAGVVLAGSAGALRLLLPRLESRPTPLAIAAALTGLIMGLLMLAVYERLRDGLDRIFSSDRHRAAAQGDTSRDILRTLDVKELLDLVARSVYDALHPLHVAVYIKDPQTGDYQPRAWESVSRGQSPEVTVPHFPPGESGTVTSGDCPPAQIAADNPVVRVVARERSILSRDHVLRFHSLAEARPLAAEMARLGAHLVAPMVWEDELIGLVIVGDKRSDDMYVADELRYLTQMIPQVSLALQNAELYAQTARLKDFSESILQEMDNAVVVVDGTERIVVFNPAAERLFDLPAAEAIGKSLAILPQVLADCIHSSLSSGISRGQSPQVTAPHFEIVRDDGTPVPLACSASPIGGRGPDQAGAVAVISDLSLMKELERERQEAERLALIRVISAGMAHEIRNPLVAIRTFTELAPRRLHDPEFRSNFLTVAQQEINRIDKLVSDLLTLSKPADAVVQEVDLKLICEGVLRSVSARAEASDLSLHMQAEELDGKPEGDASRVQQALMNLVTNAIEAEPPGGEIGIAIERATDDEGTAVVRVRVHNPGSYIAPEHIEEIFRPFFSDTPKGTGLGLAISQTIVEEHGGKLSVVSTKETGTGFIVELPLKEAKVAVATAGEHQP
jgi:PAS domain S-box-containing protein